MTMDPWVYLGGHHGGSASYPTYITLGHHISCAGLMSYTTCRRYVIHSLRGLVILHYALGLQSPHATMHHVLSMGTLTT